MRDSEPARNARTLRKETKKTLSKIRSAVAAGSLCRAGGGNVFDDLPGFTDWRTDHEIVRGRLDVF